MIETKKANTPRISEELSKLTPEEIECVALEAGLCCDRGHWFSPAGDPDDEIDVSTEDLARFANLVFAHAVKVITSAADRSAQG